MAILSKQMRSNLIKETMELWYCPFCENEKEIPIVDIIKHENIKLTCERNVTLFKQQVNIDISSKNQERDTLLSVAYDAESGLHMHILQPKVTEPITIDLTKYLSQMNISKENNTWDKD